VATGDSQSVTGAELACEKADRYRPLGAFGKPAWQSHVQLRAMLLSRKGPKVANYFAKPTYDPETGLLRWSSEAPGLARPWQDMAPEEQAQRALQLELIRSELMGFASELREQGGSQPGGAAAFASLLDQAVKVPAQGNFLHFVGEQPVIAFWGFENHDGASLEPAAQAPRQGKVAAAAAAPVVVEKRKRPWWWWLLWALLALLLLLGPLLGLRYCATPPPPVPLAPEPVVPKPEPPTPEPVVPKPEPPAPEPVVPKPEPTPLPPLGDTTRLKPYQDLSIPPGALERGDLSFLGGIWQLGDGRVNEYRGEPSNTVATNRGLLQFDQKGNGTYWWVERRSLSGTALPDGHGEAKAWTDGKKLYIRTKKSNLECQLLNSNRTQCHIVNDDGHRWDAPLRRLQ